MPAPTTAQVNTLLTYFLKKYDSKYAAAPTDFNRFRDKWAFKDMIADFGMDHSKEIVDFYFSLPRYSHPVNYLVYNYEKLSRSMKDLKEDREERVRLRKESEARVEAFRNRRNIGN